MTKQTKQIATISPTCTTRVTFYSLFGDRNAASLDAARRIVLDVYRNQWGLKRARIVRVKPCTTRNPFGAIHVDLGQRNEDEAVVVIKHCSMLIEG